MGVAICTGRRNDRLGKVIRRASLSPVGQRGWSIDADVSGTLIDLWLRSPAA